MAHGHGFFRLLADIRPVDGHGPGRRLDEAVEDLDKRRLARAGMTDDADKFPFMDFDIRIVKGGLLERRPIP